MLSSGSGAEGGRRVARGSEKTDRMLRSSADADVKDKKRGFGGKVSRNFRFKKLRFSV